MRVIFLRSPLIRKRRFPVLPSTSGHIIIFTSTQPPVESQPRVYCSAAARSNFSAAEAYHHPCQIPSEELVDMRCGGAETGGRAQRSTRTHVHVHTAKRWLCRRCRMSVAILLYTCVRAFYIKGVSIYDRTQPAATRQSVKLDFRP